MGRIGRSLALGQGFSNRFNATTGPTAWEPPLYPFVMAGVFKLFGIHTHGSAIVLLGLNSFFCANLYSDFPDCQKVLRQKASHLDSVAMGGDAARQVLVHALGVGTSLQAFLLALIFWLTLDLEERKGFRPWLEFGFLGNCGLAKLPCSHFCRLPDCGPGIAVGNGKASLAGVALASLVFVLCITPWSVRNSKIFGRVMFLRSNFGAELRIGNGPWADGTWRSTCIPHRTFTKCGVFVRWARSLTWRNASGKRWPLFARIIRASWD